MDHVTVYVVWCVQVATILEKKYQPNDDDDDNNNNHLNSLNKIHNVQTLLHMKLDQNLSLMQNSHSHARYVPSVKCMYD
jgi:hypothetical protein